MKRVCFIFILTLFIVFGGPAVAEQDSGDILKAIVRIRSIIPNDVSSARTLGTEREGHGVLIDSKGHILTIGYLIVEAETIEVFGPDNKVLLGTFVGYDHNTGFGLLRAEKPLGVAPMDLGKSSEVKEGDPLLVAGHGGSDAVQVGRVIARKEFIGYWEYLLEDAFFVAPPYSNFGGAALMNRSGQLVGIGSIFTQVTFPGVGSIPCNMFVPIDLLKPILPDLIAKGRSPAPPRPWLGLNVEETQGRVIITRITSGTPAEQAGLRPGDIILTVNKKEVNGLADFYRKVWALGDAGVEVPLTLLQGIRVREIVIRSSDRYQFLRLRPQKKI